MSGDEWKRLGDLLTARRVALGGANRTQFLEQNGITKQARIISDIELAKRSNYERATLSLVEVVYRWEPGSIDRVLAGKDPIEREPGENYQRRIREARAKVSDPADDVEDDPVLFLLTQEERERLRRRPKEEQRRVLEGMRASARAVADAVLATGDEE